MPSAKQHRRKADANLAFLNSLPADASPEWKATVAFYAAVHLVEMLRGRDNGSHSSNHGDRLNYIGRHPAHRVISVDFDTLYDASLMARYQTLGAFTRAYPNDAVDVELIQGCLRRIESYASSATNPATPPSSVSLPPNP